MNVSIGKNIMHKMKSRVRFILRQWHLVFTIWLLLPFLLSHSWATSEQAMVPLRTLRHSVELYNVAFSPNGKMLAVSGRDNKVRLWNTRSWQLQRVLQIKDRRINFQSGLTYSPDGKALAAAGFNNLSVWDMNSDRRRSLEGYGSFIQSIAFSPHGALIAVGAGENEGALPSVTLMDSRTGQVRWTRRILDKTVTAVTSVAFSPDGHILASADDQVKIWNIDTGKVQARLGTNENIHSIAFSPDGKILAVSVTQDDGNGEIRIYDAQRKKLIKSLTLGQRVAWQLTFSPNGKMLASANQIRDKNGSHYTGDVTLWNIKTGHLNQVLTGHTAPVYSVAFSPDGKLLASASEDKTVNLWRIK